MTVRELIEILNEYNDNAKVVLKPSNSEYVENIGDIGRKEISSLHGKDFNALVINGDGGCGSI